MPRPTKSEAGLQLAALGWVIAIIGLVIIGADIKTALDFDSDLGITDYIRTTSSGMIIVALGALNIAAGLTVDVLRNP